MLRLENKVALVTGASRGIGKAIAVRFAIEGASVVLNYRENQSRAEETRREIQSAGRTAICIQADVGEESEVRRMVETALREFGRIDILVNNAGVLISSPLLTADWKGLNRMLDINLKGTLHCVRAVSNSMLERKYGRIINISSVAALGTSFAGSGWYATTKAAVISLTKRLAFELGEYNITVNAIAPGFIKTDMALFDGIPPEVRNNLELVAQRAMLGRLGEPDDVANAALFLASDEAAFITAQTLTVDGGRKDLLSHSA